MKLLNLFPKWSTFVLLIFIFNKTNAQHYTWVKGSTLPSQSGIYGSKGISSMTTNPGARASAAQWTDNTGNFWLFGGFGKDAFGNDDFLNDLWKYTPLNNQWTWIHGDSMVNKNGFYGSKGIASSFNRPGNRTMSATWTESTGILWLFGGTGYDYNGTYGSFNDLWKYTPPTNQWTWMGGDSVCFTPGVYGTMGQASSSNFPGAREGAFTWKDNSGNLWMFGGQGCDSTSINYSYLNDLWKYSPATNKWTWIKGSPVIDQTGFYGPIGSSHSASNPGGRYVGASFQDQAGNFWLFGGEGFSSTTNGKQNDLWKYQPSTNQWTWMSGDSISEALSIYGFKGVPYYSSVPGARFASTHWTDSSGDFWILGGNGFDTSTANSNVSLLNDLWKYNPSTNKWVWVKGDCSHLQNDVYGSLGIPSPSNTIGARFVSSGWIDNTNTLWVFGGFRDVGNSGPLNDLWKLSPCHPTQTISIISTHSMICKGEKIDLSIRGVTTCTWSTLETDTLIHVTPPLTREFIVYAKDNNDCILSSELTQSVSACTGLAAIPENNKLFIYPNPNSGRFFVPVQDETIPAPTLFIFDISGKCVLQKQLNNGINEVETSLVPGLYIYRIGSGSVTGKLIVD